MKKSCALLIILGLAALSTHAEVIMTFADGVDGPNGSTWTFGLTNDVGVAGITASNNDPAILSGTFSSTKNESFSIGVDAWATFDPVDFSASGASQIKSNSDGAGVTAGVRDLNSGEAIVMTFDISGLAVGNKLQITGVTFSSSDGGFYRDNENDTTSDQLGTGQTIDLSLNPITVNDWGQFAFITEDARLRLTSVTFDVIPEPATLGLISACGAVSLFVRRLFVM